MWQAVVSGRTSCKVLEVPTLFRRPTAPQLAAFILPSRGRVPSSTWPHRQTCDTVRNSTKRDCKSHHGRRSDDLGTNRLSTGALLAAGTAAGGPGERCSSAARSPFFSSADALSGFGDFAGNNALDQPRTRSSGGEAGGVSAALGPDIGMSDAMSLASKYASFGISEFGALPFRRVARTASANRVSG